MVILVSSFAKSRLIATDMLGSPFIKHLHCCREYQCLKHMGQFYIRQWTIFVSLECMGCLLKLTVQLFEFYR